MNYTLITGASMGIGLELARIFAAHKHNLILVARSGDKLNAVKQELEKQHGIQAKVVEKNLALPGSARALFEYTVQQGWEVDILVNNAGIGIYGLFEKTEWRNELEMMELNMLTLTELSKLYLAPMLEKKQGRILNVSSTAAFQPGPLMAIYYASKAYVLSFSEAIANELKDSGISVSVLCPGPTESQFKTRANMRGEVFLFSGPFLMKAPAVARAGYQGLMKGKRVIIPGFWNKISPLGARLFPRNFVTFLVRTFQETRQHNA